MPKLKDIQPMAPPPEPVVRPMREWLVAGVKKLGRELVVRPLQDVGEFAKWWGGYSDLEARVGGATKAPPPTAAALRGAGYAASVPAGVMGTAGGAVLATGMTARGAEAAGMSLVRQAIAAENRRLLAQILGGAAGGSSTITASTLIGERRLPTAPELAVSAGLGVLGGHGIERTERLQIRPPVTREMAPAAPAPVAPTPLPTPTPSPEATPVPVPTLAAEAAIRAGAQASEEVYRPGQAVIKSAAFRSRSSGVVHETGKIHDVTKLPAGTKPEDLESGFVTGAGEFIPDSPEGQAITFERQGRIAQAAQPPTKKQQVAELRERTFPATPPGAPPPRDVPGTPPLPEPQKPAVERLVEALKAAKPVRVDQERVYRAERVQRVKLMADVRRTVTGRLGHRGMRAAAAGQFAKLDYAPLQLAEADVSALHDYILMHPKLREYDALNAGDALERIIAGKLPEPNQVKLLDRVFGEDLVRALMRKRGMGEYLKQLTLETLNVPRELMASFDMSAPFRQGMFFATRGKQFGPAFIKMHKYAFSEKAFNALEDEIISRETYPLMEAAGVRFTRIGTLLGEREEPYMGALAEKIPGVGIGVRASNRAFTGFLDKLRADVFDDILKGAKGAGVDIEDTKFLRSLGSLINAGTGRGTLGKKFEDAGPLLNVFFFSPRLQAARLTLMNPVWIATRHPYVQKEYFKSLFSTAGAIVTILKLMEAAGYEVETDPTNADWGKIKQGNTRYDPWGGHQQYVRFAAMEILGRKVSSTTGRETRLNTGEYGAPTRLSEFYRFTESKASPLLSFVWDSMRGKDFAGQPFSVKRGVVTRLVPMMTQDWKDAADEWGVEHGAIKTAPAFYGVGVQTYGQFEPSPETGRR